MHADLLTGYYVVLVSVEERCLMNFTNIMDWSVLHFVW